VKYAAPPGLKEGVFSWCFFLHTCRSSGATTSLLQIPDVSILTALSVFFTRYLQDEPEKGFFNTGAIIFSVLPE
jgi:hypothetical protein